jgi:hypothetical protein
MICLTPLFTLGCTPLFTSLRQDFTILAVDKEIEEGKYIIPDTIYASMVCYSDDDKVELYVYPDKDQNTDLLEKDIWKVYLNEVYLPTSFNRPFYFALSFIALVITFDNRDKIGSKPMIIPAVFVISLLTMTNVVPPRSFELKPDKVIKQSRSTPQEEDVDRITICPDSLLNKPHIPMDFYK